jgi:hypothetical protein
MHGGVVTSEAAGAVERVICIDYGSRPSSLLDIVVSACFLGASSVVLNGEEHRTILPMTSIDSREFMAVAHLPVAGRGIECHVACLAHPF